MADEEQVISLLQGTTVLKSQPLYSTVSTKSVQPEARVNGATLVLQPPPGVTTERMSRTLQCHAARAALGQIGTSLRNDPFVLPGSWLDINVLPQPDGYAVTITAKDIAQGLSVLRNANAFAENHRGWVDNRCLPTQPAGVADGCPQRPSPAMVGR
jgi:hypothetical protein